MRLNRGTVVVDHAMSNLDAAEPLPSVLGANPKTCRVVPLTNLDNATLTEALSVWRGLSGDRCYPARADISPRILKPILRNTTLVRVLDAGSDYEFRIVGDAYVMAHGVSFQGKRWSEISAIAPGFQKTIKPVYDRVVREREALAIRGWIERGNGSNGHVFCEYLCLPLGECKEAVDHILTIGVYIRQGGIDPVSPSASNSFSN